MKKLLTVMLFIALLGCMSSGAIAAELLDVKPVVTGNAVSIEITADLAMTYTYYKVPGQARAVVDIAEADPEKVEPLIVVNKGAISSISVDKAQISGIVVSRLIFNLVSEADISVSASPDRKMLTVTFGGAPATAVKQEPKPEPKPEPAAELRPEPKPEQVPVPVPVPAPAAKAEPPAAAAPAPVAAPAAEEDPLGLDEPAAKSAAPPAAKPAAAAAAAVAGAVSEAAAAVPAAPTVMRIPKLEPVVPAASAPASGSPLSIKEITTGATFIEIRTNQPLTDYKTTKIGGPERLIIDIPCEKMNQKAKSVTVNKFGISKARIGISQKNIRVVLDTLKGGLPAYTVTSIDNGLRINFK